jgi:hypothetical protein
MHFKVSLISYTENSYVLAPFIRSCVVAGVSALSIVCSAQTVPTAGEAAKATTLLPVASNNAFSWPALNKAQQAALSPLAGSWEALNEGQKRKWLAIASTYSDLKQPEQEKLHSRMAEWAALSPKDREVARLNFAQSKAIAKSDRTANWEAYQALSSDERKKLADVAKVKPVGAAVAVKPVAPEKLTAVPVTRRTPASERETANAQMPLNRNTLLPKVPATPSEPTVPAPPSKP